MHLDDAVKPFPSKPNKPLLYYQNKMRWNIMQELGSWIKTEMKAKNHSELPKYVLAFRVLQSETM